MRRVRREEPISTRRRGAQNPSHLAEERGIGAGCGTPEERNPRQYGKIGLGAFWAATAVVVVVLWRGGSALSRCENCLVDSSGVGWVNEVLCMADGTRVWLLWQPGPARHSRHYQTCACALVLPRRRGLPGSLLSGLLRLRSAGSLPSWPSPQHHRNARCRPSAPDAQRKLSAFCQGQAHSIYCEHMYQFPDAREPLFPGQIRQNIVLNCPVITRE